MNARLEAMRARVRAREHAALRLTFAPDLSAGEGQSWMRRQSLRLAALLGAERPVILPDERIAFVRTVPPPTDNQLPPGADRGGEWVKPEPHIIGNICADWGMILAQGLVSRREVAIAARARHAGEPESVDYLDAAIATIDAVLDLAARYAAEARRLGRDDLAATLERVPADPARTFGEALQSQRILQAAIWASGSNHVGLGRFDQYMWPYLDADLRAGRLDEEGAFDLLAEYFICLNKDSDLYPGVQLGDNGQSLMLGGVKRDGTSGVNPLTTLALRVSREVNMIDPKLNLRVDRNTDVELLTLAASLTKQGLGFPQYANDDVVIPGLIAHGYDPADARDYTVAACWEFIVPGKGIDNVNIGAASFAGAADAAIRAGLAAGDGFAEILARTKAEIRSQVHALVDRAKTVDWQMSPFYSVLMDGCLELGEPLPPTIRYRNFGILQGGASTGADALAAVKRFVFDEESVSPAELLGALASDFAEQPTLRQKLVNEGPKVGNDDDLADEMLKVLFDYFADACESYGDNGRGGIVRPATGAAMNYIWHSQGLGATADGRLAGQPFSANLAPSLGVQTRGPISALKSFSKIDYRRVCNGGPITLELSDSVFRDDDSLRKVALLVRAFARLGCQQMQLNTLNYETLLDAQAHPEEHRNLIVRVWGWSGYFTELSPEYQEHVIARHRFALG